MVDSSYTSEEHVPLALYRFLWTTRHVTSACASPQRQRRHVWMSSRRRER